MRIRTYNFSIALEAIQANKLKSALSALGIIFGVASVIIMVSIGKGAKQEILENIKQLGSNNIWIQTREMDKENTPDADGLTLRDYQTIKLILNTNTENISSVMKYPVTLENPYTEVPSILHGVEESYFKIFNLELYDGSYFTAAHNENALPVCVISTSLASKLFPKVDPLYEMIKCNGIFLRVIGIYKTRELSFSNEKSNTIHLGENDVYIPVNTALINFGSNQKKDEAENFPGLPPGFPIEKKTSPSSQQAILSAMIVQLKNENHITPAIDIVERALVRLKQQKSGIEVFSPEHILKQQQRSRELFNMVLGAIACISLLVGGIGIMNIMYASVNDRINEIGVRLAVGANDIDILEQFLFESTLISFSGGIVGILAGVILSKLTSHLAGITTIITIDSILIAFFVAAGVGISFGYFPSKKAAKKDPLISLQHV